MDEWKLLLFSCAHPLDSWKQQQKKCDRIFFENESNEIENLFILNTKDWKEFRFKDLN
jgi:hypothetical protein